MRCDPSAPLAGSARVKAHPISRIAVLRALVGTVALGFLSRRVPLGISWWDKSLGDVLYAVAVYLVLAGSFRVWSPRRLGSATLLLCSAIELFQLTGIPAAHSHSVVVRWLIGTQFSSHDLACYLAGTLAIAVVDGLWRRRGNAYI